MKERLSERRKAALLARFFQISKQWVPREIDIPALVVQIALRRAIAVMTSDIAPFTQANINMQRNYPFAVHPIRNPVKMPVQFVAIE